MQRRMIYDIGMHTGRDTEFYLKKGFMVIAVEAAPFHVKAAEEKFAADIASGQLKIIDRALFHRDDEFINFYVNERKDDWGSIIKAAAEKDVDSAISLEVQTITLNKLIKTYGVPYYLKIDIEGADPIALQQLCECEVVPPFVSAELNDPSDLDAIGAAGYKKAQLVNQNLHVFVKSPFPPLEGNYVDSYFDGHTSGLFGRELEKGKWVSIEEAKDRYIAWNNLRMKDPCLGFGWLDVHATYLDF